MEYKVDENCIFCNIAHKKVPGKIIFENDYCCAFLDIRPVTIGHCLLVPKNHLQVMQQADEKTVEELFVSAKKISNAMIKGMKVKGTTVFIANGVAAGQKAPHLIVHIIPRNDSNKDLFNVPEYSMSEQELNQLRIILRKKIDLMLGKNDTEQEKEIKKEEESREEKNDELTSYLEAYADKEKSVLKEENNRGKEEEKEEEDLDRISEVFK